MNAQNHGGPTQQKRLARRAIVVVGALGSIAALSACSAPRPGAAATVGNGRIESSDLASRVDALVAIPSQKGTSRVDLQRAVLAELITDRIDDQVAKQNGVSVSAGEIAATISSYKTATGSKTDAQVEAAVLSKTGPSGDAQTPAGYAGLESFARDNVLLQKVRTAFAAKLPITDAGLHALYDSDPLAFDSADISVIVLQDPAKAQADYLKLSKNPSLFADVAKIDSLSSQSAANGGEVGTVRAGQLGSSTIDSAIYGGKAGEVLQPIDEQGAYLIIKINTLDVKTFDQARASLVAEAKSPSGAPTVSAISQQRKAAAAKLGVWVNPRFGSWAGPASMPATGATALSVTAPNNPLSTVAGVVATSAPDPSLFLPGATTGTGTTGTGTP